MPLDPSVSLNIAPVQMPNPLDTMDKLASTQNLINQNKLFGQTFAARQAIGPLYQQAIDPQTGQLDTNKLLSLAAQDPRTAFMAGDLAQQALSRQQQQTAITGEQLNQAHQSMGLVQNQLSSLLNQPNVTPKDVIGVAANLMSAKAITPEAAAAALSGMPQDPAQLKPWLQQHLLNSMDAQQRLTAMYGAPQVINTGGQQQIVQTSPLTGATRLDGAVNNTVSPEAALNAAVAQRGQNIAAAEPVGIPQPNGQTAYYTKGQIAGTVGGGAPLQPVGMSPQLGAGRSADLSVDALAQDRQAAAGAPGRIYQLSQALTGLQGAQTGEGSEALNTMRGVAATLGMGDGAKNASYDEANKYLTQYAMNAANALGGATDGKIATALSGNASTHISNLAAQDVVRANIGLERMGLAAQQAFQTSGLPENQWLPFKQQWTASHDPRAFVLGEMPPSKAATFVKSLPADQQQTLAQQYNAAVMNGWVPAPAGWTPPQQPQGAQ